MKTERPINAIAKFISTFSTIVFSFLFNQLIVICNFISAIVLTLCNSPLVWFCFVFQHNFSLVVGTPFRPFWNWFCLHFFKIDLILSRSDKENPFRILLVTVGGTISLLFSSSSRHLWTRCCKLSCSEGSSTVSIDFSRDLQSERTLSNTLLGFSSFKSAWFNSLDLTTAMLISLFFNFCFKESVYYSFLFCIPSLLWSLEMAAFTDICCASVSSPPVCVCSPHMMDLNCLEALAEYLHFPCKL